MYDGPPPDLGGRAGVDPPAAVMLSDDVDLRRTFDVLWRRKGTIVGITLLLMLATVALLFQVTPRYRAEASLLIDARRTRVVDVEEVLSGLTGERETIESERRVIASRELAEKVVDRLQLSHDPEFNAELRTTRPWQRLRDELAALGRELPDGIADLVTTFIPSEPANPSPGPARDRIVDAFLKGLEVNPDGRSRVLTVSFVSEKPELAAKVANTLAELYLADQLEAKAEATRRAVGWLTERTAELRERVGASENAVETYRRQAGLIEGKGVTVPSQQVAELNSQLILARTTRTEAEARLKQAEQSPTGATGGDTIADVLKSPTVIHLKEQEADVSRRMAELSNQYGARHPRMAAVGAELAEIRSRLEAETQKVRHSLHNDAAAARSRESLLGASLDALKGNAGRANGAEVRLRALEREAGANRVLFENFLARLKETSAQQDLQRPDARLISRAAAPEKPAYPPRRLIYAGAFVLSLALAVWVAFTRERLDPGFRSSGQIEAAAGVAGLGLVPLVGGPSLVGRIRRRRPADYVVGRPSSAFAESLRILHTGLILSHPTQPPKVVLVTSSVPREGKSTIALSLGRLLATSGRRVLMIDADLRRSGVAASLRLEAGYGLADVLRGDVDWRDAVCRDDGTGLDILVAGRGMPGLHGPSEAEALRRLLEQARDAYDLVILDSPPVIAVSEVRVFARLADATVFVVRWAHTPRETCGHAIRHVRDAGGGPVAVVLSMVDVRQHARYRYGDSGSYRGASRRYYVN